MVIPLFLTSTSTSPPGPLTLVAAGVWSTTITLAGRGPFVIVVCNCRPCASCHFGSKSVQYGSPFHTEMRLLHRCISDRREEGSAVPRRLLFRQIRLHLFRRLKQAALRPAVEDLPDGASSPAGFMQHYHIHRLTRLQLRADDLNLAVRLYSDFQVQHSSQLTSPLSCTGQSYCATATHGTC